MRYIVAVFGFFLVGMRALFPDLRIDHISAVLFCVSGFMLLIPDIGSLIHRVQKLKLGGVELELGERIQKLAESTDEYATKLKEPRVDSSAIVADEFIDRVFAPNNDPRSSLILVAVEIEKTVRRISDIALTSDSISRRPYSTTQQLRELIKEDVIPAGILPIFKEFWGIRTRVMYSSDPGFAPQKIYALLDLGIKVLRILKATEHQVLTMTKTPKADSRPDS